MKDVLLNDAVDLAGRVGYAMLATTDDSKMPHIASVGTLNHSEDGHITVEEWFCPGTVRNLQDHDSNVSIVVWDPLTDTGYQLLGEMVDLEERSMMDGYMPDRKQEPPQVQRRLTIRVDEVLHFSQGPHRDEPVA